MIGKQRHILLVGGIVVVILLVLLGALHNYGKKDEPAVKPAVGFLLQGRFSDKGWNHTNYMGIQQAVDKLGLQLDSHESMTAGSDASRQAIAATTAAGEPLVFLASADYAGDMEKARKAGSKQIFAIPALEQTADAQCVPYFIRLYQGEYLAGILSGMRTKTGRIGYVASTPVPETVRCINAFTLGARKVNPRAEVVVYWIGSWDDANRETAAANQLIDRENVDILNSHQDRAYVQDVAAERGIDFMGYQESMGNLSEHNMATVVCNWSVVYSKILQDYQQGRLQGIYWEGLPEGAIDLTDFSASVTDGQRDTIDRVRQELQSGHMVFSGEIFDLDGRVRCEKDETVSDATLIHMDWYVEGVRFYE